MKIGFIGAGNMGGAILTGYAPTAKARSHSLMVYDPNEEKQRQLQSKVGDLLLCASIEELSKEADIIILAVKPNQLEAVLSSISPVYSTDKLVISMAAGISIAFIEAHLGETAKIIRIMPNTPAQVREAMTAVCRNANVDDGMLAKGMEIFQAIGSAEEVDEALIHCVIGVSGSSPAYTYMYIDALAQAAVDNGMAADKAKIFAAQSVLGAAKMVLETGISPQQLRINVCSPGGTTIEAVNKLIDNGFEAKIKEGFQAAVDKSKKMTK